MIYFTGLKENTIECFADLRNEYPKTTFVATGNAPIASGKTLFARNLAEDAEGYCISLDNIMFADFCQQYPDEVKKITGVDPRQYGDAVDAYIFDHVLSNEKFYGNYLDASASHIEVQLCRIIQNLMSQKNTLMLNGTAKETPSYRSTGVVFSTPKSKHSTIVLDMSPMPQTLQENSDFVYDIYVPRANRFFAFLNREIAKGEMSVQEIQALVNLFTTATTVEENCLNSRPQGQIYFDNTTRDFSNMKKKTQETAELIMTS